VGDNLQDTTISASTTLTPPAGVSVNILSIQPEGANVRLRTDGNAAVAGGVGYLLTDGNLYQWDGPLDGIAVIEESASATVNYTWHIS